MDEIFEKTLLFDFYGELLTEKQKKIYELYHLDDLSLSEISEQMDISRQGVFDTLKRCHNQLQNFEDKLLLVKHFLFTKSRLEEICETIHEFKNSGIDNNVPSVQYIEKIETITKSILEDL